MSDWQEGARGRISHSLDDPDPLRRVGAEDACDGVGIRSGCDTQEGAVRRSKSISKVAREASERRRMDFCIWARQQRDTITQVFHEMDCFASGSCPNVPMTVTGVLVSSTAYESCTWTPSGTCRSRCCTDGLSMARE